MNRSTFVKICVADKDRFLSTKLHDEGRDGFDLTLWDGQNVWNGTLTEDDMDTLCSKLKIDFDSYVKQTAKAFTHENMGDISFQYALKKSTGNQVEFIWKKLVPSEEIKFQLGSVKLSKEDDTTKATEKIFSYCINSMLELNAQIKSLETDNERLSQERTNALKRLDKCVTAKEEMEKDLYSKFVAVLNSKKQKIKDLKENGHPAVIQSTSKAIAESDEESIPEKSGISHDDSNYEENTDDEAPASKRARKTNRKTEVKNDAADTSLLLDDGMDEAEPTLVTRPQRRKGGNKKQTPSKPVLPKVPSGSSSSSGEIKRTSIRKSTSAGNRSTAEVDAEDLFDDL